MSECFLHVSIDYCNIFLFSCNKNRAWLSICPRQVRLACCGDLDRLLMGRAAAEWRQVFTFKLDPWDKRREGSSKYEGSADAFSLCLFRYQGEERGIQAYYKPSCSPCVHSFLGAGELDRSVDTLWTTVRQTSRIHMYNQSVRSVRTRPLDGSTQLGELTNTAGFLHGLEKAAFNLRLSSSRSG